MNSNRTATEVCRDHWKTSFDHERASVIRLRKALYDAHQAIAAPCDCSDCRMVREKTTVPKPDDSAAIQRRAAGQGEPEDRWEPTMHMRVCRDDFTDAFNELYQAWIDRERGVMEWRCVPCNDVLAGEQPIPKGWV